MRCPRCETDIAESAVRCHACRAPLLLADEPLPARLDRAIDLDRRRRRLDAVEDPALTPPPAPPIPDLRPARRSASAAAPATPAPFAPRPSAEELDVEVVDVPGPPLDDEPDFEIGEGPPEPEPAPAVALTEPAGGALDAAPDELDFEVDAAAPGEEPDFELGDPGEPEPEEAEAQEAPEGVRPASARRGAILSIASIAIAATFALVAFLTWH